MPDVHFSTISSFLSPSPLPLYLIEQFFFCLFPNAANMARFKISTFKKLAVVVGVSGAFFIAELVGEDIPIMTVFDIAK